MTPDISNKFPEKTSLEQLNTLEGYSKYFMDVQLWKTYVQDVCLRMRQQGIHIPCRTVRAGLPGTYPTFIVDEHRVIKFFGELFDGAHVFEIEEQVNRLLMSNRVMPAPTLVASGSLFEDKNHWHYIIFEYIPGVSIGEIYEQVPFDERLRLAQDLGRMTRHLHRLPLTDLPLLSPTWDAYLDLLRQQRSISRQNHLKWKSLPVHLVEQIDSFLPSLDNLVDKSIPPHLIHADLTRDHILGKLEDGKWHTNGIIDFGDAMVGDLVYELLALHLDLFHCDKRLLRAYLESYGVGASFFRTLPERGMSTTLLHRCNVLTNLPAMCPEALLATDLHQLAALLWDLNQ